MVEYCFLLFPLYSINTEPEQLSQYTLAMVRKPDDQGSIPSREKRFFSTTQPPDRLWGKPSCLFSGYKRLLPFRVFS
jgi:hypothetical protein